MSLLSSVFEEVFCTIQLPLAKVEHALAYPRQLRHVIDSISASKMAERCRILIVPRASVSTLGRLLDGVRSQRIEDANSADIERPSIVRVEPLRLRGERFDDLVQDTSKMSFRPLPVIFHLVEPSGREVGGRDGAGSGATFIRELLCNMGVKVCNSRYCVVGSCFYPGIRTTYHH